MKSLVVTTLLALAAPFAVAQDSTTPVIGLCKQDIIQGFNLLGITLHHPTLAAGTFTDVSGTTLTDSEASISVTAGRTYILEINSGTLGGSIQEVPAANITSTTITTPEDLSSALTVGDNYSLRLAPTLAEVFKTDGSSIAASSTANAATADNIWISDGAQGFTKYYLNDSGEFRAVSDDSSAADVYMTYVDAVWVQRRNSAPTEVRIAGEIKTVGSNSTMVQGINLLGTVAPIGMNLNDSGLADDVQAGFNERVADNIWVPIGNGNYDKYFLHVSGSWRDVTAPTVNLTEAEAKAISLPSGVLIQRRTLGQSSITLAIPTVISEL